MFDMEMKLRTPADEECGLFCFWFEYVIRLFFFFSTSTQCLMRHSKFSFLSSVLRRIQSSLFC